MQVIRLVEPGKVDRVIGFNELPQRLLTGIRRGGIDGFPRHWKEFFKEEKNKQQPFYFLEHTMLNADKERWQEISGYVRHVVDKEVRLLDKLEDMARPMAPDSYSQLTIEPEDITMIPIPKEVSGPKEDESEAEETEVEPVVTTENSQVLKKKPGRPRKTLAAAI